MTKEEGLEYAKQRTALFIETSAKTSEGVAMAFEEVLLKILQTPGLLDRGTGGIKLTSGDTSLNPCNWISNMLSSVWNTFF